MSVAFKLAVLCAIWWHGLKSIPCIFVAFGNDVSNYRSYILFYLQMSVQIKHTPKKLTYSMRKTKVTHHALRGWLLSTVCISWVLGAKPLPEQIHLLLYWNIY